MKLTTTAQVSVDGVMHGPGGQEEDERGRFERGGWARFDDEASTVMDEIYQRADAFLFGRRTYEIFAGSWGSWADPGDSPIWTALSTKPKYVASTSLTDPRWANTTVLSGDVAAAVGELKAHLGFGRRGDPIQPQNGSDDCVEERVQHGAGWYEIAGPRTIRVSVPHRIRRPPRSPIRERSGPGEGGRDRIVRVVWRLPSRAVDRSTKRNETLGNGFRPNRELTQWSAAVISARTVTLYELHRPEARYGHQEPTIRELLAEIEVAAILGTSRDELATRLGLHPSLFESLVEDADVNLADWRLTLLFTPR